MPYSLEIRGKIFVCTLWDSQKEIEQILKWGCFQETEEEKAKREEKERNGTLIKPYDLLYNPLRGKIDGAYYLGNRILCQKLCNNSPSEYSFLYHEMEIIELYKYAAVGLANYHVSK